MKDQTMSKDIYTIINTNFSKNGRVVSKLCNESSLKKFGIFDEVLELTSFDLDITLGQRLKLISSGNLNRGKCKECGKPTKYDNRSSTLYRKFCSTRCSNLSKDTQEKYKKTCLDRYGVENGSQKDLPKELFDKSWLVQKHYDEKLTLKKISDLLNVDASLVTHWFQRHEIKVKQFYKKRTAIRKINSLKKYGVEHPIQKKIPYDKINFCQLYNQHIVKKIPCIKIAKDVRISNSFLCRHMNKIGIIPQPSYISSYEHEIVEFLKQYTVKNIVLNDRTVLNGKELDVYLPEYGLAIEFNGLYWHSTNEMSSIPEFRKRHLEKTESCEKQNIKLFQIFENEWIKNSDIWKSMILNAIGMSKKIYARKCTFGYPTKKECRTFLNNNHLQGAVNSSFEFGLYHDKELVSLMTFGKNRFGKTAKYELLRFCSKINFSVIGGFQKLLKASNMTDFVSYGNRRWCCMNSNVYKTTKFQLVNVSAPNYFYTKDKMVLESRNKYQKHKLHKVLENFDPNLSEKENMLRNSYRIIYDAGNLVYSHRIANGSS